MSTREPLFDIQTLTGNDTVTTWLLRTNQIINSINTLYVADVFEGDGICTFRADGIVTIKIDPGPGIGFTPTGETTLTFNNVSESSSTTAISPVLSTDYFLLDRSSLLRKVKASSLLPTLINHVHTFAEDISYSKDILLSPTRSLHNNSDPWVSRIVPGINSGKKGLMFEGLYNLWSFENNLALGTTNGYSIISKDIDTVTSSSVFNFSTHINKGANLNTDGDDIEPTALTFNFNVGAAPSTWYSGSTNKTTVWPATWSLNFDYNSIDILHRDSNSTDDSQVILSLQKLGSYTNYLALNGSIYIEDLENSPQFITGPDGTSYKVPLTNTSGILNKKFTNRIKTTDYSGVLVAGDVVAVSTETDGSSEYIKALAQDGENYDVVGIVESVSASEVVIVLNGEFELSGGTTLTPGSKYYLSQTVAGEYVEEGTYTTGILKPLFVALSANSGILISSGGVVTNNISSITVNYNDTDEEETLNIDVSNFDLKFIAGQNIKFDVTPTNEISIRVDGLAGAQDTFKNFAVNGVGGDGDGTLTPSSPTTTLNLVSNSLSISANNTSKTITLETPNIFTNFRFIDAANTVDFTHAPDSASDTLVFQAGSGVTFTYDTNDAVTISALADSIVADDVVFTGSAAVTNYAIITSDSSSTPQIVSLRGGGANGFTADWASVDSLSDLQLDNTDTITFSTPAGVPTWTHKSIGYTMDSSYANVGLGSHYIPDELAGFMFGRVTPSTLTDNITNPSSSITRLTRRDVRYFLGIAPTGFIDTISNVYWQWEIVEDGAGGSYGAVEAESKNGTIRLKAGNGILLSVDDPSGTPSLLIENTGTAQTAFSNISVYSYSNTETAYLQAETSSDTLNLKSGRFIEITGDTNDELTFDISVTDDYVLLGNSGTTDGMGLISLANSADCFVGRANGGEIQALTNTELAWTGSSDPRTAPILPMPYFGLIKVNGGGSPGYLNANTTGQLTIDKTGSITLAYDDTTNTLTIGGTTGGTTGATNTISNVLLNSTDFTVDNSSFNKIQFTNSANLIVNGSFNSTTKTLTIEHDIKTLQPRTFLANASSTTSAIPSEFTLIGSSVLYSGPSGLMSLLVKNNLDFTALTLRKELEIPRFNTLQSVNGTSVNTISTIQGMVHAAATLRLTAGTNVLISAPTATLLADSTPVFNYTINAQTNLTTDTNPIFNTTSFDIEDIADNESGRWSITRIRHGNSKDRLGSGNSSHIILSEIGIPITQGSSPTYCATKTREHILSSGGLIGGNLSTTSLPTIGTGTISSSVVLGSGIIETEHAATYQKTIRRHDGVNGTYTLLSGAQTYNAITGNVIFTNGLATNTTNQRFNINNLKLGGTFSGVTDAAATTTLLNTLVCEAANATSYFTLQAASSAETHVSPSAGLRFWTNDQGVLFNLEKAGSNSLDFRKVTSAYVSSTSVNALSTTISSTGSLVFLSNVKFGPKTDLTSISVDFTGASVTGLTPGNHASTHKFTSSEATNDGTAGADPIQAWMVGAVNRLRPTMQNTICITSANSSLDFNNAGAVTPALIYNNATYSSIFGDTNITSTSRGPLYVVLANGQESNLTAETAGSAKGPPGQIIFIRKA
jgi:hypothetical protein